MKKVDSRNRHGHKKLESGNGKMTKEYTHARQETTNKAIAELYEKELITNEQEGAARTLFRSCLAALYRTTDKGKPAYKETLFLFDSPLDMAIQFITLLPKEWAKWQAFQKVYDARMDKNNDDTRPSINRLDPKGHYELSNIEAETIEGNRRKANEDRKIPTALLVFENGGIQIGNYDSITEAGKVLQASPTTLKSIEGQHIELAGGQSAMYMRQIQIKKGTPEWDKWKDKHKEFDKAHAEHKATLEKFRQAGYEV